MPVSGFQMRGTERKRSKQQAVGDRERLRSTVEWNAAETPESGGFPRWQSVTFDRIRQKPAAERGVERTQSVGGSTTCNGFMAARWRWGKDFSCEQVVLGV